MYFKYSFIFFLYPNIINAITCITTIHETSYINIAYKFLSDYTIYLHRTLPGTTFPIKFKDKNVTYFIIPK